jgi:hypothetical protein
MPIFWLSFADVTGAPGDEIHSVITVADDLDAAFAVAHAMGCVPADACSILEFDDQDQPPPLTCIDRLLNEPDIAAMHAIWAADQSPETSSSGQA